MAPAEIKRRQASKCALDSPDRGCDPDGGDVTMAVSSSIMRLRPSTPMKELQMPLGEDREDE